MGLYFGATLQWRAVSEQKKRSNLALFSEVEPKHDYEEKKNDSPLQKRDDFQNYSPREAFWISFFLSVHVQ